MTSIRKAVAISALFLAPPVAHADQTLINRIVDIRNTPVAVQFDYRDRQNNEQVQPFGSLPPALTSALPKSMNIAKSPLLSTSLWTPYTALWSKLANATCANITSQLASSINGLGPNGSNTAYGFGKCMQFGFQSLTVTEETSWPDPNGGLNDINGYRVVLDFSIPMVHIPFYVTTSTTCKSANAVCAQDPQFTYVFNIDLVLTATSSSSSTMQCPLTIDTRQRFSEWGMINGSADEFENAVAKSLEQDIGSGAAGAAAGAAGATTAAVAAGASLGAAAAGSGGTALAAAAVAVIVKLAIQSAGAGVAAAANSGLFNEVSNDRKVIFPTPVSFTSEQAFKDLESVLGSGCAGMGPLGFSIFDTVIAATGDSFVLRLSHPMETTPPTLANLTPDPAKMLLQPQLVGSVPQVQAGKGLTVTGNGFTDLLPSVGWSDLTFLSTTESDLNYRESGAQNWTPVVLKTNYGNQGYWPQGLSAGKTYQFEVRDCDLVTCTPYQQTPLAVTVPVAAQNQVTLYLDDIAPANKLGTASIVPGGTISVPVTIGAKTPVGDHKIVAAVGSATTPAGLPLTIKVVAAGQALSATLQIEDVTTHAVVNNVVATQQFVVQGTGFGAGSVVITFANVKNPLGTVTVPSSGSFSKTVTTPAGMFGDETLVATQTVNGKPVQTKSPIYVQSLPQ